MAVGFAEPDATEFELVATRGSLTNGICSGPFLERAFRTIEYRCKIKIISEDSWSYDLTTVLEVDGQKGLFEHTDKNTLVRVAAPTPNPLMLKI